MSYDADKLTEKIDSLQAVTGEQTPAVSAYPKFDGEQYVIEPEQYGTASREISWKRRLRRRLKISRIPLISRLRNVMRNRRIHLNLLKVQSACDLMNQYCKAKIVYPMTEEVVVDASVISGWLTVDDKMQVTISEDAVREWLEESVTNMTQWEQQGLLRHPPEGRQR